MTASTLNIPSVQHLVSPEEWQLRVDLAACYRLVALYGWSDLVLPTSARGCRGLSITFSSIPMG